MCYSGYAYKPGTYTLHEEAAPEGGKYVKASDIEFTVDTDGNVTRTDGKSVTDNTVEMTDEYADHDVSISKQDINGDEIEGAQLTVTGTTAGGDKIEAIKWTSDGSTKTISLQPGTYTLHEEATPDSNKYVLASDIEFTVDADGNVTRTDKVDVTDNTVVMVDEYAGHDVKISKVDAANSKELKGAELTVKDADGNTVDNWTSDGSIHKISVQPGTYTLTENQAPLGYDKAESITFTVDTEGKVTVDGTEVTKVTMEDARTEYDVEISKVDAANGKELPGAKLQIKDKDGNVVEEWTSTDETHFVKLTYGEYTLTEITAPNGYEVAESIKFTVEKDGTITSTTEGAVDGSKVTMKDAATGTQTTPSTKTTGPKTGDFAMTKSWMLLLLLALAGLAGLGYSKKKQ